MMALSQNFGTSEKLIVLHILQYEYCVNKSRDMSRAYFAKNCKYKYF